MNIIALCAVCAISLAASDAFVNDAVKREVWISSLVVRTDLTIHYTRISSNNDGWYLFGLDEERVKDLAYVSFFDPTEIKDLASRKLPSCPTTIGDNTKVCWEVQVPLNGSKFGVKMANIDAMQAFPKRAKLEDPFRLRFSTPMRFWSPYETKKEKTIIA